MIALNLPNQPHRSAESRLIHRLDHMMAHALHIHRLHSPPSPPPLPTSKLPK